MEATFPSAASRACTSGSRSARGTLPGAEVCGWRARTRSRTSCKMAISSALSTLGPPLRPFPGGRDHGGKAAARREIAGHGSCYWIGRPHHILQHAVHYILLEDADIA